MKSVHQGEISGRCFDERVTTGDVVLLLWVGDSVQKLNQRQLPVVSVDWSNLSVASYWGLSDQKNIEFRIFLTKKTSTVCLI